MYTFIDDLKKFGYKYMIVPKGCRKKFYATKAEMFLNDFSDNDDFDEFKLENDFEVEVLKIFDKGVFINLQS